MSVYCQQFARAKVFETLRKTTKPFRIARNGVCWPAQDVSCSGLERLAATAALTGLGIGNLEPVAIQFVFEIDCRAAKIICAERVHQYRDAVKFGGKIVVALFIKDHAVLHPRTAAAFNEHAKRFAGVLLFS